MYSDILVVLARLHAEYSTAVIFATTNLHVERMQRFLVFVRVNDDHRSIFVSGIEYSTVEVTSYLQQNIKIFIENLLQVEASAFEKLIVSFVEHV